MFLLHIITDLQKRELLQTSYVMNLKEKVYAMSYVIKKKIILKLVQTYMLSQAMMYVMMIVSIKTKSQIKSSKALLRKADQKL